MAASAVGDMEGIRDHLKNHSSHCRQPTTRKLYEKIRAFKDTPHIGRLGRIEATRELLTYSYIAVYRVIEQTIKAWSIWHTSQSRSSSR